MLLESSIFFILKIIQTK